MQLPRFCPECDETLSQLIKIYTKKPFCSHLMEECTSMAMDYDKKKKSCIEFFVIDLSRSFLEKE